MSMHPKSSVVFSVDTEIFVEAFTFSISIVLLMSEPKVMDEIWPHSLILMNDVHSYEVFVFLVLEFLKNILFSMCCKRIFLAYGSRQAAHYSCYRYTQGCTSINSDS